MLCGDRCNQPATQGMGQRLGYYDVDKLTNTGGISVKIDPTIILGAA